MMKIKTSVGREHNGPVLLASPDGGVDIEEVAEKTPHRVLTLPIDIFEGEVQTVKQNTLHTFFVRRLK